MPSDTLTLECTLASRFSNARLLEQMGMNVVYLFAALCNNTYLERLWQKRLAQSNGVKRSTTRQTTGHDVNHGNTDDGFAANRQNFVYLGSDAIHPVTSPWRTDGVKTMCSNRTETYAFVTEAKIIAFGVASDYRNQGIGRALQQAAMKRAKELGCYQVRSRSDYANAANFHLKIGLGFGIQPSLENDSVYFVKILRAV